MTTDTTGPTAQRSETAASVQVEGLRKTYGKQEVLNGIDLRVTAGKVLGLLGPNGAGKTTTVRCLTTLARPTGGTVRVAGRDVVREPSRVRSAIALAGQHAAVDGILTGKENLILIGRLLGLGRKAAQQRATELLESFDLVEAGQRRASTYSGGMQRRLDLAIALIGKPEVLFLDEPTAGLDPRSRLAVWQMIRTLRADGLTVVLTTQYLEEADELADHIVLIDRGVVIAEGTPDALKQRVGSAVCVAELADDRQAETAAGLLHEFAGAEVSVRQERHAVTIPAPGGLATLMAATEKLRAADLDVEDIQLRRPTLDEVFLSLTGHDGEDRR
ncbi:ATP-binding cassette domain-containing protein [Amycolatopsis sp. NPDC004079]|uniref:ATP-binding cassette domain-containing protein n=1 Tax=Amycolatopsis sp. NPDC004079 TaxID=3154549 RepID=UPI0033A5217C